MKHSRVDLTGFNSKMTALLSLGDSFESLKEDATAYFLNRLTNEVINGVYVGVISGNHKRSYSLQNSDKGGSRFIQFIESDLAIAPYSLDLAKRSKSRHGKVFVELTKFFWGKQIGDIMAKEVVRMTEAVSIGKRYVYRNPFPAGRA